MGGQILRRIKMKFTRLRFVATAAETLIAEVGPVAVNSYAGDRLPATCVDSVGKVGGKFVEKEMVPGNGNSVLMPHARSNLET
jgi:hypothetical protein